MFFGAWVWILLLALLALALSAWVKWRPAAGGLMFGLFFVASAFGAVINGVQRTNWGHLFNVSYLVGSVWVRLFEGDQPTTDGAVFFRAPRGEDLPLWASLVALAVLCAGLPVHAGAQDPRRGGGAVSDTDDHLRRRFALLRRSAGHQQRQPDHSAGHHQPGGPQRFGQDHADEPDDRAAPRHAAAKSACSASRPIGREQICRLVGYCAQFDAFPKGLTGFQFIYSYLLLYGMSQEEARERAVSALQKVNMTAAAGRPVAAYSKGMRQRVKLAQAIAHDPRVLVLDEPLNGLDPMARAETIALFREWGADGRHVIVSSHILHEVDSISDQVILLSHGYVVAEGQIQGVRSEVREQPMQILVRCDRPAELASRLFAQNHVVEAKIQADGRNLLLRTKDADAFYLLLNRVILDTGLEVESVAPADDDVNSVYQYLIGRGRCGMNALWMRQIGGRPAVGMEEDVFLQARLVDLLPGAGPVAITGLHWLFEIGHSAPGHTLGDDSVNYAAMFQFFYLRGAIFFGCMGIFSNLFRAEMLEKTLHYYYLTPLRRELLVAAKYLAGLTMAVVLFAGSAAPRFC